VEHVKRDPNQSLGVITFSEAQMVAIQAELDARKRAHPELEALLREDGPDAFFVKNLENVQGDERDVIFFSVGYGPDENRHMTMNFGPLNRQGGERRLNVAITRAHDRVKILASFLPHEIDRGRTQAKGVHLLRSYLEFADQGPKALLGEITAEGGEPESPFEEAVADALQAHGLRVISQVGVGGFRIDLGIKHPTSDYYILGVECDGATYHSSHTARDRDRLRQQVLERLGWTIHRVWSTDWLKDPERELAKALAAYQQTLQDRESGAWRRADPPVDPAPDDSSYPPLGGASTPVIDDEPTAPIAPGLFVRQPLARRYTDAVLPHQGSLDDFYQVSPGTLARLVRQCVEIEGPVHEERVMRAVAQSFGINRVGPRVRERLEEAIRIAAQREGVVRRGTFLWFRGMTTPPIRAANITGAVRRIDEVPPDEIAACVVAFLGSAFSIGYEHLVTAVAREMGYARTGSLVAETIGEIIGDMLTDGTLIDVGGQIRLAETPPRSDDEGSPGLGSAGSLDLPAFFSSRGIEWIDNRTRQGGSFWVVGGRELDDLMAEVARHGLEFRPTDRGARATDYRPGWYLPHQD
jgi:very-short-patch-repair endonuclease